MFSSLPQFSFWFLVFSFSLTLAPDPWPLIPGSWPLIPGPCLTGSPPAKGENMSTRSPGAGKK